MAAERETSPAPADQPDSDLPDGWTHAQVGDVVQFNYGKGLKDADRRGGPVPVYGSNGVVGQHDVALTAGPTIIVGRKGSVGAVHFSPKSCWPIDTTYFIDDFGGLDPTYLVHALRSLRLEELDTSTAIPGLNRNDAYRQTIFVPPAPEQQRIVNAVDNTLGYVNASRERLARLPAILKRFRQAVLAAACSGRLTADWRDANGLDAANSRDPNINEIRWDIGDAPDLPAGWCHSKLSPLLSETRSGLRTGPFGSLLKKHEHRATGIPVLGIENIGRMEFVAGSKIHISPEKARQLSEYDARPGDVLISRSGTVGEVCVVPDDVGDARISTNVMRVCLDSEKMLPQFFCMVIEGSPLVAEQLLI
jgi:type I restriction enzyme, S subunit